MPAEYITRQSILRSAALAVIGADGDAQIDHIDRTRGFRMIVFLRTSRETTVSTVQCHLFDP